MNQPTHVDLVFPARGRSVPLDHGYALYGALSRRAPALHGADWFAVHPIGGTKLDQQTLALGRTSSVTLRIPPERIRDVLCLAGAVLDVRGATLALGAPMVRPLEPAPSLDARLVVIKLTRVPRRSDGTLDTTTMQERFVAEAERQLTLLGIARRIETAGRRSITIAGRRVLGYSVRVAALDPEESLLLQVNGLGGKRTMGCGVFRPTRRDQA